MLERLSSARRCATAIGLFVAVVVAVPWDGVQPTPADVHAQLGVSPKPTGAWPEIELFKRQSVPPNVCGYVTRDRADSVTCGPRYSCVYNVANNGAACCTFTGSPDTLTASVYPDCSFYTSCVNYADISSCSGSCLNDADIIKCVAQAPACYTFSYVDAGYVYYGCQSTGFYSEVYATYIGEIGSASSIFVNATTATISPITPGTTHTSSTTTTNPGISVASSSTTISTTTSPAPTGSSKTSIAGPIAGGVVGGLAVIAIFVGVIAYFCLNWNKNKPAPPSSQEPVMVSPSYMHSPPPPTTQGYFPQVSPYHSGQAMPGFGQVSPPVVQQVFEAPNDPK